MTEPQNPPPYPPPQPGQWAPQPPPKKRKKWPFILGGIIVLIVIIAVAVPKGGSAPATSSTGGAARDTPASAQNAAATSENVVTYEVTGPAKASVTYMSEGFQTSQVQDAKLPFKKDIQFKDDVGKFSGLSLVAQNSGTKGDITCRILLDGKEVAKNTSSGSYAVVTCTGANI